MGGVDGSRKADVSAIGMMDVVVESGDTPNADLRLRSTGLTNHRGLKVIRFFSFNSVVLIEYTVRLLERRADDLQSAKNKTGYISVISGVEHDLATFIRVTLSPHWISPHYLIVEITRHRHTPRLSL